MSHSSVRNVLATDGMRAASMAAYVALVMALAGCTAQAARPSAMDPTTLVTAPRLGGTVALTVDASALTGAWQRQSLWGQSLRDGIGGALVQHGVFDKVVMPEDDPDFVLNIEVRSLAQPSVGLLPWWSGSLSTVWRLHQARSGKFLLNEIIITKATQTFPEALIQGDRGLTEALVRNAIIAAIGRIDSSMLEGSTK